jgi:hypothetical protein
MEAYEAGPTITPNLFSRKLGSERANNLNSYIASRQHSWGYPSNQSAVPMVRPRQTPPHINIHQESIHSKYCKISQGQEREDKELKKEKEKTE